MHQAAHLPSFPPGGTSSPLHLPTLPLVFAYVFPCELRIYLLISFTQHVKKTFDTFSNGLVFTSTASVCGGGVILLSSLVPA